MRLHREKLIFFSVQSHLPPCLCGEEIYEFVEEVARKTQGSSKSLKIDRKLL